MTTIIDVCWRSLRYHSSPQKEVFNLATFLFLQNILLDLVADISQQQHWWELVDIVILCMRVLLSVLTPGINWFHVMSCWWFCAMLKMCKRWSPEACAPFFAAKLHRFRILSGLVTNSILFCWLFKFKDQCKKVRFQRMHVQGLHQLFLTVSWDLRA